MLIRSLKSAYCTQSLEAEEGSDQDLDLYERWIHVDPKRLTTGLDKQNFQRENANFSYPSVLTYVFGAQKNRLTETVLLSTQNIYFGWEIRNLNFRYALLTKVLIV